MLAAHKHVFTAVDHVPRAAAVLIRVTQAVGFQIVDQDGAAALNGDPGIGPAASGMDTAVAAAQRRPAVPLHVGRPGLRRADALMRAIRQMVGVLRDQGAIAEPGLWLHIPTRTISRQELEPWH